MVISRLYAAGKIAEHQYRAALAWTEDGQGVMHAESRTKRQGPRREPVADIMRASAAERFKRIRKRLQRLDLDEIAEDVMFRGAEVEDADKLGKALDVLAIEYGFTSAR